MQIFVITLLYLLGKAHGRNWGKGKRVGRNS